MCKTALFFTLFLEMEERTRLDYMNLHRIIPKLTVFHNQKNVELNNRR